MRNPQSRRMCEAAAVAMMRPCPERTSTGHWKSGGREEPDQRAGGTADLAGNERRRNRKKTINSAGDGHLPNQTDCRSVKGCNTMLLKKTLNVALLLVLVTGTVAV